MANKFARSNGNFDGPIWALTSSGVAGSTTAPTIGDNAIANTFTIQITGDVACDNITNDTTYGGLVGGTFVLAGNLSQSLTANCASCRTRLTLPLLSSVGTQDITVVGNIVVPNLPGVGASTGFVVNSIGKLKIYGNITSGDSVARGGTVVNSSSTDVYIKGNLTASPNWNGSAFLQYATGVVVVDGNLNGGYGGGYVVGNPIYASGIVNFSNADITITGNIIGGTADAAYSSGFTNTSTGPVTVYGNLNGSNASALSNTSTGPVTVYGNLNGSKASALSNTSTGPVTVVGNVIGNSLGGAGITSSNANANVKVSGNLIGAPNGIPAVYTASYTVNPVPSEGYIRHANNGTGVGSNAYLYYYTTDALSAFSVPPVSAVRAGLQYANNTLTGTCEIPPASSVTFGVPVDNNTGTAALTSNNLFDVSIASLTATDSLGARLKNSATVESVGIIIASF